MNGEGGSSGAAEQRFDAEVRVRDVRYEAPDGGFAVLVVEDAGGERISVAGPLAHIGAGDRARIVGRWTEHPQYGLQVQADTGYELDPDDSDGALKYLTTISRIGKRRARQLVERHGAEVLAAIDVDPEGVFAALPRMSERAAAAAAQSWRERRALRDLYVLLAPHGAGWLASALYERHGTDAIALVRTDPYRLTEEHGVGFQTADAIAVAQGVPRDSPGRYRAAVVHALQRAETRGHTYLPAQELRREAERLVGPLPPATLDELAGAGALEGDRVDSPVGSEGDSAIAGEGHSSTRSDGIAATPHGAASGDDRFALPATWRAEAALADRLGGLAATAPAPPPPWLARAVEKLTDEQRGAVEAAFERRLSVVTGGPGTGKTTLVRTVAELAGRAEISLALCAPTGRAARRLEEATGHPATTIHRLLEWLPHEGPLRGPSFPIECDLLVVDESSMLSLQVAKMLFDAVDDGTSVVMVGDADQLPPIGAGKPFADLIESGAAPVAQLTHVFRQSAKSMIVSAAHAVRSGERPSTQPADDQLRDFFLIEHELDTEAADTVVDLATGRLARHYDIDPIRELQVLSPIYRGALGIDALNARLRAALNPHGDELLDGDIRTGDKLIQTRNDYDTGLMNGQTVIALGADDDEERLEVEVDDGRRIELPASAIRWLRPAYAISVHRSQGCELPVVVIPVHNAYGGMLSRNLLYTAITRAKTACVLVGQPEAVARAARRADAFQRHTRLAELVGAG
ncbi:MAG TPA: AAA family ATPase [Thermoleophilaceae bacterium]|nr:AAA family ATPase [Thermoleophilaceae bacterium]